MFPDQNKEGLRKAISDVSSEIDRCIVDLEVISSTADEVMQAECECCGLKEDCTQNYVAKVRGSYSGNWVCGLCIEAVKDRLVQVPKIAIQEAVGSHREFCQNFNSTTRLNPKLSLTLSMRDIAKRSSQKRNGKLARSSSCFN